MEEGAEITAYDPQASEKAKELPIADKIKIVDSVAETVVGAEALIIATEWPEFASVDFASIRDSMLSPLIFDGRNLLDPQKMAQLGFEYHGIGRPPVVITDSEQPD